MKSKVINKSLVVSDTAKAFGRELIIKRKMEKTSVNTTKLSEVLNFLPNGFIYKDETGIGATTLEIRAKRNSIIIEPIKITASSKAFLENAFYIGSPTKYHPEKSPTKKDILAYIQDPKVKYKKFIVVADSLKKLLKALGPNLINNFFFLIDEIDSFQLDSTYRKSMEDSLDIYKEFKKENRAMLSATRIDFTDPKLSDEPVTYIKYDQPTVRDIKVVVTYQNTLQAVSIDQITEILINFPKDKIFIAYNSIGGCYNIAKHIADKGILKTEEISLLCSSASKDIAREFYKELSSTSLPSRINLFTSAYFTGFDIDEKYHLVSISGNISKVHALSDRRLKQIAGRCRIPNGLISETIVHDIKAPSKKNTQLEDVPKNVMIEDAGRQINALNCFRQNFLPSKVMTSMLEDLNHKFLSNLDDKNYRLIRKDSSGNFTISYLNLDAKIESSRVSKDLYSQKESLANKLIEDGHNVVKHVEYSNTIVVDQKGVQLDRDEKIKDCFEFLRQVTEPYQIELALEQMEITTLQRTILKDYLEIMGYVDHNSTLDKLEKNLVGKRDSRTYNKVKSSILLLTHNEGTLLVQRFNYYFPVGIKLTPTEIYKRIALYAHDTRSAIKLNDEPQAVKLLNNFRKTYRKTGKDGILRYAITSDNPFGIQVLKRKKAIEDLKLDFK